MTVREKSPLYLIFLNLFLLIIHDDSDTRVSLLCKSLGDEQEPRNGKDETEGDDGVRMYGRMDACMRERKKGLQDVG